MTGGGGGRRANGRRGSERIVVVDTMAPLEMFRRFLVASLQTVPGQYGRMADVFPCTLERAASTAAGGGGGRGPRVLVDAEGDSDYIRDRPGRRIVGGGRGIGLLRVPDARVRGIDYKSSSGRTSLMWRWVPGRHSQYRRRSGRVHGMATLWSLEHLGGAGVVTAEWAAGQRAVARAKRARADGGWAAAAAPGTMNRRDRRAESHKRLREGRVAVYPTGYERAMRDEHS